MMSLILTKLFLIILLAPGIFCYDFITKQIEMPLDHFSFATNKTFKLRYLENNVHARTAKSPIFFYTGNEGDIELFANNTGFMWQAAQKMGASLVFAEHRYYGKSLPFQNNTFDSLSHLGYLTSEQALADFAALIRFLNPDRSKPVIAFGGSYGGMLSAWLRIKYPHLVDGSLASSAPIFQFPGMTDCLVFNRILTSIYSTEGTNECSANIRKSWDLFKNYSSTNTGKIKLNNIFKFCSNLTSTADLETFFDYLQDVYANLAMANYPYENSFLAPLPAYPLKKFCKNLEKSYSGDELLNAMRNAINIYANYTGETKCINYANAFDTSMGIKAWDFQSCTEMVMPMCSDGVHDMFPKKIWNAKKYSDKCFRKYGVYPNENIVKILYGGKNISSASNIIFSNGLLDPWSGGGVFKSPNNKIFIIIILEGAHHIDLRGANENDPTSVRIARQHELEIIHSWIKDRKEE